MRIQITCSKYNTKFESDCTNIISALPDWFGIPERNAEYIRNLAIMPSWVAVSGKKAVGVITLEKIQDKSFEIHFLAVHPKFHGKGIGRALVSQAEKEARRQGGRAIFVKTLGPSRPDRNYAKTRAFYEAMGFTPLFESTAIWGKRNPALIMVKLLQRGIRARSK
jgi:ribosomal protein S18 acetylase RimI-like enzyme